MSNKAVQSFFWIGLGLTLSGCGAAGAVSPSLGPTNASMSTLKGNVGKSTCPCMYVTNFGGKETSYIGSITVYTLTGARNRKPIREITGPDTQLGTSPDGVALDSSGNIYVSNSDTNTITVYPAGSNGDAVPTRVIAGSATGLDAPAQIAVDSQGALYVANYYNNSVIVFAPGANGNVYPVTDIVGPNTTLKNPAGVGFDSAGNIYASSESSNAIAVFAPGSQGNVAPIRTIVGRKTQLWPTQLALDANDDLYVANVFPNVTEYGANASGNVAPIRVIKGGRTGLRGGAQGVALDAGGNIYASVMMSPSRLNVYAATANGDVNPIWVVTGSNTQLLEPEGIAIH